jgi:hypothetical protein
MKNKKKVDRISAEGLLVALETASGAAMVQRTKEGEVSKIEDTEVEIENGKITIQNLGALVFTLVHPWVAIHTEFDDCRNTDEAHENEYAHMVSMAKALLKARAIQEGPAEEDN